MLVKYLGPSKSVHVPPFPDHPRDEIREYPDEFGADLVAKSRKQQFVDAETEAETEVESGKTAKRKRA